ncbi:hypothetical protein Sru01_07960 [Sphaerisporangium rufum]|uniref:Secreted protein n=1 Tax=Sphaerisporangium rufum TaxID=1381558 RepID=A0A919QXB8_9ACTN|nr:hypothetical protein [Sphaerisporangium rufum]GII75814.1 hypothetical protein Sru01_07960 [Sphaerisporangium rufum]
MFSTMMAVTMGALFHMSPTTATSITHLPPCQHKTTSTLTNVAFATYGTSLVAAAVEGKGKDIFMIKNSECGGFMTAGRVRTEDSARSAST